MSETTLDQLLEQALRLHQAGQFPQAEALYRQVLTRKPNNPSALHLLGVLAFQLNRPDVAVDLIARSIVISPDSAQAHGNLGLALAALGKYDQAIASYRYALNLKPDFLDARNNLGAAYQESGQLEQAILAYRQALEINPHFAGTYNNLASALQSVGRIDEAIQTYHRALELDPNIPEAHNNLANALKSKGQTDDALISYRKALSLRPDFPQALNNLAVTLSEQGKSAEALTQIQKAISAHPSYAEGHNTLANILKSQNKIDQAIAAYSKAITLKPDYAEVHNNLGVTYHAQGQVEEAVASLQTAARLSPNSAEIQNNLGCALKDKNLHDEALAAFEKAVALKPDLLGAIQNLGLAYRERGKLDQSITCYHKALQLKPNDPDTLNDLANAEKDRGNLDLALSLFRQGLAADPSDSLIHSNILYSIHFHPAYDSKTILSEHLAWAKTFAEPLKKEIQPLNIDPSANRRIRIGYVSPDLRGHVVGRHLLPLLANHDRTRFEIFCYTDVRQVDTFTRQLRQHTDQWRNIIAHSDAQLADLVRADHIDILVDLTLHAAGTRLLAFARKPAPVQITWLGYCSTTGMSAIDYRISDPYLDPPNTDNKSDENTYIEKTLRLPRTYWCYQPAGPTDEISPLPAQQTGQITFGCLNNFAKVSTDAYTLWNKLLLQLPGSRLILYTGDGSHRDALLARSAQIGVNPDRIIFFNGGDWNEYTRVYQQIDIALDPFPYGGGITTCDALWMGVPVITLTGQTAVGRGGTSLLTNVGLPELIAKTLEEYLRIAENLATDLPKLSALRQTLRTQMQKSPLMDAEAFAKDFENLYRDMMQKKFQ